MPSPGYGLGTIEGRVDGSVSALLDGDGLGQVTRLVDVQTLGPSQGRGEDLQRHHSQQRPQDRGGGGHPDDVVGEGLDVGIPLLRVTMVRAPRARISWMLEMTLSCRTGRRGVGTMTKTGSPSSMSAIGPC